MKDIKRRFVEFGLSCLILFIISSTDVFAQKPGAKVPWTTYEAEDNKIGGGALMNVDDIIREVSSEKNYIHLKAKGEYLEIKASAGANRLILRYSIPRGADGKISLYINGKHNQDINLTWAQCYDSRGNNVARRYDEKSATVAIKRGDLIRIQKDEDDVCEWYGIDLIDLENIPKPLVMPGNFLSITEFGATANDDTDDTQAIKDCFAAAGAQGKGIWVPEGKFLQDRRLAVPEKTDFMGAGIWYAEIHNTKPGSTYSNDIGYSMKSENTVSDIKFTGVAVARAVSAHLFRPVGNNQTLRNLWIQNIGCIYGWTPGDAETSYNIFKDSRVYGTYFDGIHFGDGNSHNNLVENIYFRGMGDDAVAQVNRVDRVLCHDNVARFCSIVASYWGRGLANIGGDNLIYSDNYISSCYLAGLMIATEPLGESVSRPVNGFEILRNVVHKCGHTGHNHAGLHFWLKGNPMKNVVIRDNIIEDGETEGVHFDNTDFGDSEGRTVFENNIVRNNAGGAFNNTSDDIKPFLIKNSGI